MIFKDTERDLWRRLVLVTFAGWAIFSASPVPISLVGVLILTFGQWKTLRSRLPISRYWLLFFPFCLLLGYGLGDLLGGNIQNLLDDVAGPSGGIRYLGRGRPPSSYFIANALSGVCIGCLLGLGQWLAVRPTTANASKAFLTNAVGLSIASASYALVHIVLQRTVVGAYVSAFWAAVFAIGGGYPSPAFDTFMWLFLKACSGVVAGILAGVAMGTSLVWCLRAQKEDEWRVSNATAISGATGACAVLAIVLGVFLLHAYPPAPGHSSAAFSLAFHVIVLLNLGSFILGPIALFQGVRALRSIKMCEGEETGRSLAWIGAALGGLTSALWLLGVILTLVFFVLEFTKRI